MSFFDFFKGVVYGLVILDIKLEGDDVRGGGREFVPEGEDGGFDFGERAAAHYDCVGFWRGVEGFDCLVADTGISTGD